MYITKPLRASISIKIGTGGFQEEVYCFEANRTLSKSTQKELAALLEAAFVKVQQETAGLTILQAALAGGRSAELAARDELAKLEGPKAEPEAAPF